MIFRATAQINHQALLHNFQRAKQFAPQSRVVAVIKANAYGHGSVPVAKTLKEADVFGVASLEEALPLREHPIKQPILLMSGFFEPDILPFLEQENIWPVIHEMWQVEAIEKANLSGPLSVWLKIDTGMHRLGFSLDQAPAIYQRLLASRNVKKPIVVMTHLADSDELDKQSTSQQLKCFQEITAGWDCLKSAANSAGVLCWPGSHFDWIRPGIMLYGATSIAHTVGCDFGLQPVMTLKARLISIHSLRKGEAVGYGATWQCPEDMLVGVVSIGYGDGYPRHAKIGTEVLINDVICPLVGRVSMDLITVDLRPYPQAKLGEEVELWGEDLPAEIVAERAKTIALQLFCNVMTRVHFNDGNY